MWGQDRDEIKLKKTLTDYGVNSFADLPVDLQVEMFHLSATWGCRRVTEYLLDQNINPNSVNSAGGTPLQSVVIRASRHINDNPRVYESSISFTDQLPSLFAREAIDLPQVVKLLLKRNADPHAKSPKSRNHLFHKSALQTVQKEDYKHLKIKQLVQDHAEANKSAEPPRSSLRSVATLTAAASVVAISVGLYLYSAYRGEEETSEGYFGEMFS